MKSLIAGFVVGLAAIGPACAFEGTYTDTRQGRNSSLVIKPLPGGRFEVEADASRPGCLANVTAIGRATGDQLTATKRDGGQTCTLRLTRRGTQLTVSESTCTIFHGASCEFAGVYSATPQRR